MILKEGDQIGYITILSDTKKRKSRGEKIWMCKCVCGAVFEGSTDNITESIRANCNISCGCKRDKSVGQRELNNPIRIKKAKEGLKQVDGTTIASITRKKINKNNKSGVRGVCFKQREQKWKASIQIKGKHIGKEFDKFEDAVMYRKYLEDEYFKPIIERSEA